MGKAVFEVAIGPRLGLHAGLHGVLIESPPAGVSYREIYGLHRLLLHSSADSLFDMQAPMECIDLGAGLAHTASLPAAGSRRWVVDIDDLAYTLFCGHYALNPAFQSRDASRQTRDARFAAVAEARVANMLWAFAHDSCKAMLVHTRYERARICMLLERLRAGALGDRIIEKLQVFYPATPAEPRSAVERKWANADRRFKVLFCGREFGTKRGQWALDAFARLLPAHAGLECLYIGHVPEDALVQYRHLEPRLQVRASLPREAVLSEMADAHVLFHPADNETVGMVLLEAAASGMAVVTAKGDGMEHVGEWFEEAGAVLVDRARVSPIDEEGAFFRALADLVRNRAHARRHGMANHVACTTGFLSVDDRDRILVDAYQRAVEQPAAETVTLDRLPVTVASRELAIDGREVIARRLAYREAIGLHDYSIERTYEL